MEANELYNLPISPLVIGPFAVEWSNDNHISLITCRGVHVLELVPHPMCIYPTFRFWRTFVYPSEFVPAEPFERLVNGALWKMKREDMYPLIMQEAVTPKIEEKTEASPRIVRVAWSPAKLVDPSKCLLAILTSTGSIELLYKLGNSWLSVWNLSSQWSKSVERETGIEPSNVTKDSFHKIAWPEHIKRLLGTAIAWSCLFYDTRTNSSFAYLVAAYRSSDIVIYRTRHISEFDKASEPDIVYKTCFQDSVKICQLVWMSLVDKRHVILIGYADGRIHGLGVQETEDTFVKERLFKYQDEADRMAISCIKFMNKSLDKTVILATKSCFLLAMTINDEGECIETRYLRFPGFSVTGLTVISEDEAIVTTQDSKMFIVSVKIDEKLNYESVRHDLKSSKVQYLGLARSSSCAILVNVTSPDCMYDHLLNREPSSLQLFSLAGDKWNPYRILNSKKNRNASLYTYWDCLESIRLTAAKSAEPEKVLPKIPRDLDGLSIDGLRVVMWLTLITRVLEKKQMLKGVDKIVGEISEAQPLIFINSACRHLVRLSNKMSLSSEEKRCASFLRMFMEIYLAGENEDELENSKVSRAVAEALEASSHVNAIETESCNLCGDVLTELPWTIDACPSGHKLPRCCVTLLQVTSVQYRTCPVCGRIFHPSLDDEYEEVRCLYCDVPAQNDSRVASSSLGDVETRWKNLSKRPALYSQEATRSQDVDVSGAPVNADKIKKWRMKPHTFAVIVNNKEDDDDDSFITETWQEF